MNAFEISNFVCKSILPKNESDDKGILKKRRDIRTVITASSTLSGTYAEYRYPQAVVEYDKESWWTSESGLNQWIMINFSKRLLISNYSMKSDWNPVNNSHPKQWKLEGYNEEIGWVTIDNVTESKINGPLLIETRPTYSNEKPFSAVRLSNTGLNWANNQYFRVYEVNFFGLVEKTICAVLTCYTKRHLMHPSLMIISLILS